MGNKHSLNGHSAMKVARGNFNQGEVEALLSENTELRKTATELLLQTTILREALTSGLSAISAPGST
jgi:hypothetical protein